MNDLPEAADSAVDLYADDSAIAATGKSISDIQEKLSKDFHKVAQWMKKN